MLAETYATEDMKKDVNDLVEAAIEVETSGESEVYKLIESARRAILRHDNYASVIRSYCEYRLGVLEITGGSSIIRQIAEKIVSLLTRYDRKQMLIVLVSALRLIDDKKTRTEK